MFPRGAAAYDPKSGDLQPADWSADDPSSYSLASAWVVDDKRTEAYKPL